MDLSDIVITIAITASVGIAILFYQRKLDQKVDKFIEQQHKMINEQYEREKKRKIAFGGQVLNILEAMIKNYCKLNELIMDYIQDSSEENKSKIMGFSKNMTDATIGYHVPHLKGTLNRIAELFTDPYLAIQIDAISNSFAFAYTDVLNGSVWLKDYDLKEKTQVINDYIKQLELLKNKLENEIPKEKNI